MTVLEAKPQLRRLLQELGSGRAVSRSAYDTAWIAGLSALGEPLGERALDWLREHQLPDGSWGADPPRYHHDRALSTLAAMVALAGREHPPDRARWQRARAPLREAVQNLGQDPAGETIGFEMIFPTLLAEAQKLDLLQPLGEGMTGLLTRLIRQREAKLATLPAGAVDRHATAAYSAEMVGPDGLDLLDAKHLKEANGSVACSPAATAFFVRYVSPHDSEALRYLEQASVDGAVPCVMPVDVFEIGWALWNLSQVTDLDVGNMDLCQPHLDSLQASFGQEGLSAVSGHAFPDGDTTGLVHEVLTSCHRQPHLEAVLRYERDGHFCCYSNERNPSVSTNIHILGALRRAGRTRRNPSVNKILEFLRRGRHRQGFWFDKWHASPYYPTAHLIIICTGYHDELVADGVDWLLRTQNSDGSWGYYGPTAEETAYALQALATWKVNGRSVSPETLESGAAWLADHRQPPYPQLWIGKCLYCPELVVRSAILSARMLVART